MENDKLIETVSGFIGGLEIAFVHLCNVLEQRNIISRPELAASFEATAAHLPSDLKNRELAVMMLRHIALGLNSSGDIEPLRLVH